jgi:hypothetical protein
MDAVVMVPVELRMSAAATMDGGEVIVHTDHAHVEFPGLLLHMMTLWMTEQLTTYF